MRRYRNAYQLHDVVRIQPGQSDRGQDVAHQSFLSSGTESGRRQGLWRQQQQQQQPIRPALAQQRGVETPVLPQHSHEFATPAAARYFQHCQLPCICIPIEIILVKFEIFFFLPKNRQIWTLKPKFWQFVVLITEKNWTWITKNQYFDIRRQFLTWKTKYIKMFT